MHFISRITGWNNAFRAWDTLYARTYAPKQIHDTFESPSSRISLVSRKHFTARRISNTIINKTHARPRLLCVSILYTSEIVILATTNEATLKPKPANLFIFLWERFPPAFQSQSSREILRSPATLRPPQDATDALLKQIKTFACDTCKCCRSSSCIFWDRL